MAFLAARFRRCGPHGPGHLNSRLPRAILAALARLLREHLIIRRRHIYLS